MKRAIDLLPISFARRRKKILDELRQMKHDIDHWNSDHPNEEPITIDFDLSEDIERMKAMHESATSIPAPPNSQAPHLQGK